MATITIVTPWLDAPELIPLYERGNIGAEIIIIDNSSQPENAQKLEEMCIRMEGIYIRNDENMLFAHANNQGLERATGDIVVFLNNDTDNNAGWITLVMRDVQPGSIYGPSTAEHDIDGRRFKYLEGWCIAATKETWDSLGGWNTEDYEGLYYEDADLAYRARKAGMTLTKTHWSVWHFGNYTSRRTPGSYDHSEANRDKFTQIISK